MSTTLRPRAVGAVTEKDGGAPQAADVFVIFGITGDLAKVMTFHSLYRLEARGLLDCPIVGVAFDDWSDKDLLGRQARSEDLQPPGQALLVRAGRLRRRCDIRAGRRRDQGGA